MSESVSESLCKIANGLNTMEDFSKIPFEEIVGIADNSMKNIGLDSAIMY